MIQIAEPKTFNTIKGDGVIRYSDRFKRHRNNFQLLICAIDGWILEEARFRPPMMRGAGFVEGQQKDIKTNECWWGGAINRCTNNLIQRGGGAATTQAKDTSPLLELVNQLIAGPVRRKKVSNVETIEIIDMAM